MASDRIQLVRRLYWGCKRGLGFRVFRFQKGFRVFRGLGV